MLQRQCRGPVGSRQQRRSARVAPQIAPLPRFIQPASHGVHPVGGLLLTRCWRLHGPQLQRGQHCCAATSSDRPVPAAGAVKVVASPGRGLGLGVSQPAQRGDLLLVSVPISLVYGSPTLEDDAGRQGVEGGVGGSEEDAEDEELEDDTDFDERFEALQRVMRGQRYTAVQAQWLQTLAAGLRDPDSDKGASEQAAADVVNVDSVPLLGQDHSVGDTSPRLLPLIPQLADAPDRLEWLIQRCSFEAEQEDSDLAALTAASDANAGPLRLRTHLLGVWPEHALLNHSCVPSTVSYVHRGALITRATRNVSSSTAGGEVFANYLGDVVMAPLDVRREALEDVWGFVCNCPRCRDEASWDKGLQQLVSEVYEAVTDQVAEDLADAVEEAEQGGAGEELASLQEQLAAYAELIGAAAAKMRLSDRSTAWLQASLFCVYESLHTALDAQGGVDLGLTNKLATLAGAVQPGSDTHVYWARVHAAAVRRAVTQLEAEGEGGPQLQQLLGLGGEGRRGAGFGRGGGGRGRGGRGGRGRGGRGAATGSSSAAAGPAQKLEQIFPGVSLETAEEGARRALSARYGPMSEDAFQKLLTVADEGADDEDGELE